jgi:hypothetical protein
VREELEEVEHEVAEAVSFFFEGVGDVGERKKEASGRNEEKKRKKRASLLSFSLPPPLSPLLPARTGA